MRAVKEALGGGESSLTLGEKYNTTKLNPK